MAQRRIIWIRRVGSVTLLAALLAAVFFFSSQPNSDSQQVSGVFTSWIGEHFHILGAADIQNHTQRYEDLNLVLRKVGHAIGYLFLGAAVMAVLRQFPLRLRLQLLIAFCFCFLYACTDEFHQLFIDGRTGQFSDVLVDCVGIVIGLEYSLLAILERQSRRKNSL